MIIIDFSGIAIPPIVMGAVADEDENLLRHFILNSIRMYRNKYRVKFGEIVIVADGGGNWRKKLYPEYKAKRETTRQEQKIDWDLAFKSIGSVLNGLKTSFPYKVIHQWGCEADDSIAELVHMTQEFGRHEDIKIISADKDFIQLQKYSNVSQYSPITKKDVTEADPIWYRKDHFLRGCKGDGVPNVLSDDQQIKDGRKATILTAKKKAILMEDPKALGEEVFRNYCRNKTMIDLTEERYCPKSIREEIINTFESQDPSDRGNMVLPYLIDNNCRLLIENVQEFTQ